MEEKPILKVEIITPDKKVFSGEVYSVLLTAYEGECEIRPEHTPYMGKLNIGEMRIYFEEGKKDFEVYTVNGGYFKVIKNELIVLTHSSENLKEIDVNRAKAALERAKQRLKDKSENIDRTRARAALMRALNRINIVERYSSHLRV